MCWIFLFQRGVSFSNKSASSLLYFRLSVCVICYYSAVVSVSPSAQLTALPRISQSTERTYVSEAIPVLDLAAILWNGGQPLLVFHEIPRFFRLFNALHVGLRGTPHQHHQRDEKAPKIHHFHHGSGQKHAHTGRWLSSTGNREEEEEEEDAGARIKVPTD